MSSFRFDIKNGEINRQIQVEVNINNWQDYRNSMKVFQKNINEYLTELVNVEKSSAENVQETEANEDSEDSDSEDSELKNNDKSPKRVLKPPDKICKIKKYH